MHLNSFLKEVAEKTRVRVEKQENQAPIESLGRPLKRSGPNRFAGAFDKNPHSDIAEIKVIAEIKFASPSEGIIRTTGDPETIARSYLKHGAAALSILTEPEYFHGRISSVEIVRRLFPTARILMKDFFIGRYQIAQARFLGADAILLIVALLGREKLGDMLKEAEKFGVAALVEVHDESELNLALEAKAEIIGVNNRDLKTLRTSLDTSRKLISLIPENVTAICESGLRTKSDLDELKGLGFDGFLIGTALMKAADPGKALSGFLEKEE